MGPFSRLSIVQTLRDLPSAFGLSKTLEKLQKKAKSRWKNSSDSHKSRWKNCRKTQKVARKTAATRTKVAGKIAAKRKKSLEKLKKSNQNH